MESPINSQVYIPIPHYPPFKLRSSLIDKDPVIWVHLLEAYIKLIKYLLQNDVKILTFKSFQQLIRFLKVYLHETSLESSRIFSLGAINPDIKTNTSILRTYIFQFLKSFGILRFIEDKDDDGEMIWNFVSIYIKNNGSVVKTLLNYDSIISKLQNYLHFKILNNEFSNLDQEIFIMLLDPQLTKVTKFSIDSTEGIKSSRVKPKNNVNSFTASFVNSYWIKLLENLFSTIYKDISKDLMIISILSININQLTTLVKDQLSINSIQSLKNNPLFGSILISDQILDYFPNLSQKLPLLNNIRFKSEDPNADVDVNEDDIFTLIDLFPKLSQVRAKSLLIDHDQNVEALTNLLLEDPSIIDKKEEPIKKKPSKQPSTDTITHRSKYDDDKISKLDFSDTTVIVGKKQRKSVKLDKNNLLISSLKLLYDEDEDEPDDTYDDQEITTGIESRSNTPAPQSKVDGNELFLFGKLKAKGEQLFNKATRGKPERQELKTRTKWTDEQIEGWYKVLLRSPHRFKILDDIFFFENPNKPVANIKVNINNDNNNNQQNNQTPEPGNATPSKRTNARNEQNKASRANHRRKNQHNKKTAIELKGLQN
ncbi:hypothetical protein DFJ63DRAFT_334294 [Scheffersomyces coipomensis]|uniref:uncharacterized protein n=1 Tax=Scheffersomyces coipomensis TaxID=1788519 RepID=UPI00315D0E6D